MTGLKQCVTAYDDCKHPDFPKPKRGVLERPRQVGEHTHRDEQSQLLGIFKFLADVAS